MAAEQNDEKQGVGDEAAVPLSDTAAGRALKRIHAILYADGPETPWDAETLDAIAEEVARVLPRPR